MEPLPDDLRRTLQDQGQQHLLDHWEQLAAEQRRDFAEQLRTLDWPLLSRLVEQARAGTPPARWADLEPPPVLTSPPTAAERDIGWDALRAGQVAVLMVAGGQGSRLGSEQPKALYPIGPVSGASLLQIHAEKVLALSRRIGRPLLWLIMTSPSTEPPLRQFLQEHRYFGLSPEQVILFCQGTLPAVAADTGALLLESPGRIFLSPDGHGGVLAALARHGLYAELRRRGVRHIFYFQVDNPLVQIGDPGFIGRHIDRGAEVSSKSILKTDPEEKVGVFARDGDRCVLVEYSDLPADLARQRHAEGQLRFAAANPAIHVFQLDFLARHAQADHLPYHVALKAVAYYDPHRGENVTPPQPNAWKFERFIFDILPYAHKWLIVDTPRPEEFAPLKNATGPDSPATVQAAMVALHRRWLQRHGIEVAGPVEISPLLALDADDIDTSAFDKRIFNGPTYLRTQPTRG